METKSYTNEVPKQRLINSVLAISDAVTWLEAIKEFDLKHVYQEEGKSCACGKKPIKNVCVVLNRKTNTTLEVGNCCIEKFFVEMSSNIFFISLNKLRNDITASLSLAVIQALHEKKLLTDFECKFYISIQRKRKLSQKQCEIKQRINLMFLAFFANVETDKDPTTLMWGNTKEILVRYIKWYKSEINLKRELGKGTLRIERKLDFLESFYRFLQDKNYLTPKQLETMWGIVDNSEMPLDGTYQRWDETHNGYLIAKYSNNFPLLITVDGKLLLECKIGKDGEVIEYRDNIGNYWDKASPIRFPVNIFPIKNYIGCMSGNSDCLRESFE